MHIPVLALPILLVVAAVVSIVRRARDPLSQVPGPWYAKWTSMVIIYHWLRGKRTAYVHHLHEKYGPVVRVSPIEVDFCSVSGAKRIHSFNRPFLKGSMYGVFRSGNDVENLFSTRNLDIHARHRRLLSAPASDSNLENFEHIVESKAQMAVEKIGVEMARNGAANTAKWWIFFSTDVIGELSFGDSFRMLEQGKVNQYIDDLQKVATRSGVRVAFPSIMKLAPYIPLPYFTDAYASTQRMRSYAEESISRYEKLIAAEPNVPRPTLFTKLFQAKDDTLTRAELVASAQSYITAGSDTTAFSLTFLTWAVCKPENEEIKKRLASEVGALPDNYSDENLKRLPYLNQVIKETLRLYAPAPAWLPRVVPPGGCEIDGYWMPGGTEVQTQGYSMHRNTQVYPNPEKFDPSRWESPTKDMNDAWMPFGGGARICIGLHLAQKELRIATARFFRAFPDAKVSNQDGFCDDDMEQVIYFLMYPKNKRCLIQAS
ncbi:cytochrome P450 [Corynespora cassiicola Philippines]|uniref:Cytochrome P450 n=1 Tax=Corynespora cassiicola Philippines TaxID=1448308 RepID=A0A2T2P063_CORCC|nr:cytochrome P450 [Corynespora cassiicola Philippines]